MAMVQLSLSLSVSLIFHFILIANSTSTIEFTGPVVSVLDGNTIEVLHNTYPERVRLSNM